MIVSASRRTDIPAFFMPWLVNRLREGYALVRSPYSPRRVARVPLTPDVLDAMVLWSKNPLPMLPHLDVLRDALETGVLQPRYDSDMEEYYYDVAAYPACPAPEPAVDPELATEPETGAEDPGESSGQESAPDDNAPEMPPSEEAPSQSGDE